MFSLLISIFFYPGLPLLCFFIFVFFFNDPATTEIYTLSLHDALPIRIREDRGVDVDHDLIALAGCAGIEPMMKRRLRDERQGVRTLLLHGGHVMRRLRRARPGAAPTSGASRPRITTMPSSS